MGISLRYKVGIKRIESLAFSKPFAVAKATAVLEFVAKLHAFREVVKCSQRVCRSFAPVPNSLADRSRRPEPRTSSSSHSACSGKLLLPHERARIGDRPAVVTDRVELI